MKHYLVALALGLLFFSGMAEARRHGGAAEPVSSPVLQNVAVNFGADTPTSRGGVQLNSMDTDASVYGGAASGLDAETIVGTPCAAVGSFSQTGGTAGHFTLPTVGAVMGATALTPVPTSAGQTAHLNGGPYLFTYSCKDAGGNSSNVATITYNIIPKAANFGTFDATTGATQASFGTTAGYQLLISTGFQRPVSRTVLTITTCAAVGGVPNCTITDADLTKPSLILEIEIGGSNHYVQDFNFTGQINGSGAASNLSTVNTSTNVQFLRNNARFTPTIEANAANWEMILLKGTGNVADHNRCYYCKSGISIEDNADNSIVTNNVIRHWFADGIFVKNANDVLVADNLVAAPDTDKNLTHEDCYQVGNAATPQRLKSYRNWCVTAEGPSTTQGIMFAGTTFGGTGYVSSGAGVTTPGKHVTMVTGVFNTNSNEAQLWAPGGGISAADNAIISNSANGGTSADVSIPTNISLGSPGSPVDIDSWGIEDYDMQGVIFASSTFNGWVAGQEQGTSHLKYGFWGSHVPNPAFAVNFTGTITSPLTLTVTGPVSSDVGINANDTLSYAGCAGCVQILSQSSGPSRCTVAGTCVFTLKATQASIGPIPMSTNPYPPVNSAQSRLIQGNCTTPGNHGGAFGIENSWVQSTITACTSLNTTLTNMFTNTTAPAATSFEFGDPNVYWSSFSQATWAAMTDDLVKCTYAKGVLPKIGGPLDLGLGDYATPTHRQSGPGSQVVWFDGTLVSGCS